MATPSFLRDHRCLTAFRSLDVYRYPADLETGARAGDPLRSGGCNLSRQPGSQILRCLFVRHGGGRATLDVGCSPP